MQLLRESLTHHMVWIRHFWARHGSSWRASRAIVVQLSDQGRSPIARCMATLVTYAMWAIVPDGSSLDGLAYSPEAKWHSQDLARSRQHSLSLGMHRRYLAIHGFQLFRGSIDRTADFWCSAVTFDWPHGTDGQDPLVTDTIEFTASLLRG